MLPKKGALWLGTMNSYLGNSALIVLPHNTLEMRRKTPEERERQILEGIELACKIGAKKIAFAGLIPTLLNHWNNLTSTKLMGYKKKIITGQTMTCVGVGSVFEKLLTKTNCNALSVVGLGSIGELSLILLLEKVLKPKKIILCDLPIRKNKLQRLAENIEKNYSIPTNIVFYGEETFLKVYEGDMFLGAVSSKNVLHPDLLRKGSILIDDSFPPIVPLRSSVDRMKNKKDVLILSGGRMCLSSFYFKSELWRVSQYLLSFFLKQIGNQGIPGCWLEALVYSNQSMEFKKNIKPDQNLELKETTKTNQNYLISKENVLKAWKLKEHLNLTLPDYHFFKYSIPSELMEQVCKYRQQEFGLRPLKKPQFIIE